MKSTWVGLAIICMLITGCGGHSGPPFKGEPPGAAVTMSNDEPAEMARMLGDTFKPDSPFVLGLVWNSKGDSRATDRKYEEALYCYQQAIKAYRDDKKDNLPAYRSISTVLLRLRKPEVALLYCDQVDALTAGKLSPLYAAQVRAQAYDMLKQYDKATEACAQLPDDYDSLNSKVVMGTKGQTNKKDTEKLWVRHKLISGAIALHKGDKKKATEMLQSAWSNLGGNTPILHREGEPLNKDDSPDLIMAYDELPDDVQAEIRTFDSNCPKAR